MEDEVASAGRAAETVELVVQRVALEEAYTIGRLRVDGRYFCDVLEDKVRDTDKSGRFDHGETKVQGQTAIPYGRYEVDLNTVSPKFKRREWAIKYGGIVPRLMNVPHFVGVLIHPGNTAADTEGCLLPGDNNAVGRVTSSQHFYYMLMDQVLMPAKAAGKRVFLEVR